MGLIPKWNVSVNYPAIPGLIWGVFAAAKGRFCDTARHGLSHSRPGV